MILKIKLIPYRTTFGLRQKILSPEKSLNEVARPGDESALHFGGYFDTELVGIISLYPQDQNENRNDTIWRIRGMVVDNRYQNQGIGSKLLDYSENYLLDNFDLKQIWCNSRKMAKKFYLKKGYEIIDEVKISFPYEGMSYRMLKTFDTRKS